MASIEAFNDWLQQRNSGQSEFIQAATDIARDVIPIINVHDDYKRHQVLHRLAEPDRIVSFKVVWEDDSGEVRVNRGWRVQQSNLLGPYKGGLRFHPRLNESVLKFLAFEQCFKNALTGLSLGGGKGGSDFDPRGRSDREIMRFCQSFMRQLQRHIGPHTDVPAGDINVGAREIGYLYGEYRRLANEFSGSITGKDTGFGGSPVREEATGFGVVYFTQYALAERGESLEGKRVLISGAGNVALHAAAKAYDEGAKVLSLSNSKGALYVEGGMTRSHLNRLRELNDSDNALEALSDAPDAEWLPEKTPWHIPCDIAMPCATQNELDATDAKSLIESGCAWLVEGANMPLTDDASTFVRGAETLTYIPGKASNAGGVAVSGLEMRQNAQFHQLSFEELDKQLRQLMQHIHQAWVADGEHQRENGSTDYSRGANVAGFRRLADALVAQGF
ncbi:MAG: NADP-specific glutamate dehydrogenase [Congregibacter sp.]